MGDVVVEVGAIEPVEQFGVEGFGFGARGRALDGVFDFADDALAGGEAMLAGLGGARRHGLGEVLREDDGAADGAGDAVEGDGGVWCGLGARGAAGCGRGLG